MNEKKISYQNTKDKMQSYKKKQLQIAVCCYFGQLLIGYGAGWPAPVIPKLSDPQQSPLPSEVSETEISLVGSFLYIGTIVGPFLTGYLSNTVGRKPCFFVGGLLTLFSFLLLANANNLAMIYAGRFFCGLGTGVTFVLNLVYIGEIASADIRGMLLTGTAIFTTFGTLVVYSIGPYVAYPIVSYVAVGITGLHLVAVFFVPESPIYLILKDKQAEAKEVMTLLGRLDEFDDDKKEKYDTKKENQNSLNGWKQILTVKSNRKALFITLTLGLLQQGSGFLAVISFTTTIFQLAGSSIDPDIATIATGVSQVVASSITPFFVERIGRKSLLLYSTSLCGLSLATLGAYFYMDLVDHSVVSSIQWLPLVTLIVFFLAYDFGFGIIPLTLIGEMFHSEVRSTGSAISVSMGWLFSFGVTTAFGYMVSGLGSHVTFWIFSGMCFLGFLFALIFVPETKGKTLDEIQDMLKK